jgi:hypothetical protein
VKRNETTDPEHCPRCSADHYTWLDCTCLWFCAKVINCTGLKYGRRERA